jgi:hypothetical protein
MAQVMVSLIVTSYNNRITYLMISYPEIKIPLSFL